MSDAALTPAETPARIAQRDARTLSITWADGATSDFDVHALRLACGCAQCVDEWSGEGRLDPATVPADVHPLRIEAVGRYALQIHWSDGHASGIYPFRRLRQLAGHGAPKGSSTGTPIPSSSR
jgi:ATP-binding protein involved in chromosome partitioning